MKPYRFHDQARAEYLEALGWYADRAPLAVELFADVVERAIAELCELPEAWPVVHEDMRARTLGAYPFRIVYLDDPTEVVIMAIAHTRRRPGYWRQRTP